MDDCVGCISRDPRAGGMVNRFLGDLSKTESELQRE